MILPLIVISSIEDEAPPYNRSLAVQGQVGVVENGVHVVESSELSELGAQVSDWILIGGPSLNIGRRRRVQRVVHIA